MNIVVVAAHPDDEVFGCGGTLLKHRQAGHKIHLLWMTNGVDAREENNLDDLLKRDSGCVKAIEFIQADTVKKLNFPDNRMDSIALLDVVKEIELFFSKVQPDIVYTHFANDLNVDHCIVAKAVMTASRPGSSTFVSDVYSFEVASSTEWSIGDEKFIPDTYVNITDQIDEFKDYLSCYQNELRDWPHARSLDSILAKRMIRGSEICIPYAEAFKTLRRIKNV